MGEVVFEVGQVVRVSFQGWGRPERVMVTRLWPSIGHVHGVALDDRDSPVAFVARVYADDAEMLAPPPKHQQIWTNDKGGHVQIVDRGGALAVEECKYGATLCHSNAVDVARWLAERDYRCVAPCVHVEQDARADSGISLSDINRAIRGFDTPVASEHSCADADEARKDDRTPVYVDGRLAGYARDVGSPRTAVTFTLPALSAGQHIVSMSLNESVDPGRVVSLTDEFYDICSSGCVAPSREPDIRPMAALAAAVAEVFTAPNRDTSRRYVDMAVRALRYEPFAKAVQATLVALVGDRASAFPSANEIMATVDACRTWEHARGMIAPAKRTLSRLETRELTEIAKLAAWARVPMLDACDIGEIVAETYERARATC